MARKKLKKPTRTPKPVKIPAIAPPADSPETDDKTGQNWRPPDWGYRYLAACLDWDLKATISARCEAAGISRQTFYQAQQDEQFVNWLNDRFNRTIQSEHREVRTALLKTCMRGDLAAIQLWHQLYGDFIPTERQILETGDLSTISDEKLADLARVLAESGSKGTGPKVY